MVYTFIATVFMLWLCFLFIMVTLFKRGEKGINGHERICYVLNGKKPVAKGLWPRFLTVANVTFCTST